jgi:hypothetical protein
MRLQANPQWKFWTAAMLGLVLGLGFPKPLSLHAGEPIRVGSPTFGTDGVVVLWPSASFPISYTTDGGSLGLDTNLATTSRVNTLFAVWQAVATSNISFTNAGSIPSVTGCTGQATDFTDGDVSTFGEFLCVGFTGNPIIYDNNGAIHDALFGVGNSTLGFAGPQFSTAGGGTIVAARAVLNGKFRDGVSPDSSDSEFEATILHELGHYIGLGHSQININCLTNPFTGTCASYADDTFGLPTMFPISITGLEESPGVAPERTLAADDIAWLSRLYPDATFNTTYGTLSGTVFFSDGSTHLQGVNVIARQQDDSLTPTINESRRNAVSATSGYLYTGNRGLGSSFLDDSNSGPLNPGSSQGGRNPALRGTYDIPVLAATGPYTIEVEAIDPNFVGGSSVGALGKTAGEQFGLPGSSPASLGPVTPVAGSQTTGLNFIFPTSLATRDEQDAVATNDTPATATEISTGTMDATISPFGNSSPTEPDVDYYKFSVAANTTATFEIEARNLVNPPIPSTLDSLLEIVDASGTRLSLCDTEVDGLDGIFDDPCVNDDQDPGVNLDSLLQFRSSTATTAFLSVRDVRGDARPDMRYILHISGVQPIAKISGLRFSPSSIGSGATSTGTVTLTQAAPAGGAVVQLTSGSSTIQVPATVTVPAGSTSANFTATAGSVTSNTSVLVSARYNGLLSSSVTIRPPKLTGVSLNPSKIIAGQNSTVTLTLSAPAPTGGINVSVTPSCSCVQTPSQVTVPAGSSSTTFSASTTPVNIGTAANIVASLNSTLVASVTVIPNTKVSGLSFDRTVLPSGQGATGTVTLTSPAPAGGVAVLLSSNLPSVQVPSAVTVPAGSTSANFSVTSTVVNAQATALITATFIDSISGSVTITPIKVSQLSFLSSLVTGGGTTTGTVTLNGAAPAGGTVVNLSSANPSLVQVPASVTVLAGNTSATFNITTAPPGVQTPVLITATQGGSISATLTVKP